MSKKNYIRLFSVCALPILFLTLSSYSSMAYDTEINSLSRSIAEKVARAEKKKITVTDFTDLHGNITELGRFLAEEFSAALVETVKGFEVVDRNILRVILEEHELSSSGTIDSQIAQKICQITGVDALITGTITPFSDSIRVTVKILDTATVTTIGASRGNIASTKDIEELLSRGIEADLPHDQHLSAVNNLPKTIGTKEQMLRALGLEHLSTEIMRPASGLQSKRVGDLDIIIKKITILPEGDIQVKLGFFNNSYQQFLGARYKPAPSLTDEKGNIFEYKGGLVPVYSENWNQGWRNGLDLPNQANRNVVLNFSSANKDINLGEIGSNFSFSLDYILYNPKNRRTASHNVSFAHIISP